MNRNLKIDLEDVLSLISCAQDYGFENDILFDSFSDMLDNKLSDEEIEWYARLIESEEGYGEEDYEEISDRLIKFKKRYIIK